MIAQRRAPGRSRLAPAAAALLLAACTGPAPDGEVVIRWYVFAERSGAFARAAERCSTPESRIELVPLPADADQQREQLVRRLAAGDDDIDVIGMDVIWTAEFAAAGWLLPWTDAQAAPALAGRLAPAVASGSWRGRVWALPFTSNAQLLWFRTDRVAEPPGTWDELIDRAERLGDRGAIQLQGERYEGLTVLFVSLLASAGGSVLAPDGDQVALEAAPTRAALAVMRRLGTSPAAPHGLSTSREDQARLAFASGAPTFMVNYTFVWPSTRSTAPDVAGHMGWARWPAVAEGRPSRVALGGLNLGIGAHTRRPERAQAAAQCLASEESQRLAATLAGLPPTLEALYADPEIRRTLPFADVLRASLRDAVQRPATPLYHDVSLAISHTLHPMREIEVDEAAARLRERVGRALRSEGLL